MGKRPYYIISYTRDYEGYETVIEYIGTNYKAALNRYIKLIEYIKQRDFLEEHVEEDRIEQRVNIPDSELIPGQSVYSYINDNDCFYISVEMRCMNTDTFTTAIFENQYKQEYPNAKH